jgi:hypothetical protein
MARSTKRRDLCPLQEPRREAFHGLFLRLAGAAGDNHRGRGAVSGGGHGGTCPRGEGPLLSLLVLLDHRKHLSAPDVRSAA